MIYRLACAGFICLALAGCGLPIAAIGVGIDIGLHGYQLAGSITGGIAQGIEIKCRAHIAREAALTASGKASTVAEVEQWSGARSICNPDNPPPSDPIAEAFWLGTVDAHLN